ncbi:MAG: transcription termination/antitermination protein NusG [Candidatus Bostrichicola ureolyticus]|nr:MAG: transcription termination/antitermination protein NusG [Candidatus Bostrichicola ureolyticus]
MNKEKKWYVIRTISGKENKVKFSIEREIKYMKLTNYLGQMLVPIENIIQIRNGKKIKKEKIHYPGYLIIEINLEVELYYLIKKIQGVINFLCEGKNGNPIPLRKEEVNKILGKIDKYENIESINIPFYIDETVKIIDGPFKGFNGTIEKINKEKKKIEVAVLIFGRKTPLELNFTQIERI